MKRIRFTLVSEGSSDRALLPVLAWTLKQNNALTTTDQWPDLRQLHHPPKDLAAKIEAALEIYPCDLLFVHRDADRAEPLTRKGEIAQAVGNRPKPPAVCVIPVKAMEAWLLFDEPAIRRVSGNPNGTTPLNLPSLDQAESISNPKAILHNAIRSASELTGRRLRRLKIHSAVHRIADLITDFSPLRQLPAFRRLEEDTAHALSQISAK